MMLKLVDGKWWQLLPLLVDFLVKRKDGRSKARNFKHRLEGNISMISVPQIFKFIFHLSDSGCLKIILYDYHCKFNFVISSISDKLIFT